MTHKDNRDSGFERLANAVGESAGAVVDSSPIVGVLAVFGAGLLIAAVAPLFARTKVFRPKQTPAREIPSRITEYDGLGGS